MCQLVDDCGVQTERGRTCGHQLRAGHRIAAGEERHLVPLAYQFFGKPGYDSLRSSVKFGRNTFIKRRNLGNSHCTLPKLEPAESFLNKGMTLLVMQNLCTGLN